MDVFSDIMAHAGVAVRKIGKRCEMENARQDTKRKREQKKKSEYSSLQSHHMARIGGV